MSSKNSFADQGGLEVVRVADIEPGSNYEYFSDIKDCAPKTPTPCPALASAIRETWPNSHPNYWRMIARRFQAYDVPENEAILAVCRGYSSPSVAMSAKVIKRRPYMGFKP